MAKRKKRSDVDLLPFVEPLPNEPSKNRRTSKKAGSRKIRKTKLTVSGTDVEVSNVFPRTRDAAILLAQEGLMDSIASGTSCACCGQRVQIYKRGLYAAQVHALILVYRAAEGNTEKYVQVPKVLNGKGVAARGGDFCKLVYWKFIEPMPGIRGDGSTRSGWWRVTPLGEKFIQGGAAPRHVFLFDGRPVGWGDEQITLRAALGDNFDYAKLMGWK